MSTVTDYLVPDPVAEALFGRTRRRVLGLLYARPHESFHLREIVRLTGSGTGAVQRELERLARAGLITRTPQGHQVHFAAAVASPVFSDLQGLLAKTSAVKAVIQGGLDRLRRNRLIDVAFIYGSIATGRQRSHSDIDLVVVGRVTLKQMVPALRKLQHELGREVNPSIYRPEEITQKYAGGDHFIRRVLNSRKLMLIGTEDALKRLAREPLAR